MKRILLLLLASLLTWPMALPLRADDDVTSELKSIEKLILESRQKKDTEAEVNALAERASLFYNYDLNDSVLTVVRRDMERVKELAQWDVYYEMWGLVASTYVFIGQNNIAIHETKSMYEDAHTRGNALGKGQANCIMGTAYSNLRNFDQSVDVFEKSLAELSKIRPIPSVVPDVYAYYSDALGEMKNYAKLAQLTQRWEPVLKQYFADHQLDC